MVRDTIVTSLGNRKLGPRQRGTGLVGVGSSWSCFVGGDVWQYSDKGSVSTPGSPRPPGSWDYEGPEDPRLEGDGKEGTKKEVLRVTLTGTIFR